MSELNQLRYISSNGSIVSPSPTIIPPSPPLSSTDPTTTNINSFATINSSSVLPSNPDLQTLTQSLRQQMGSLDHSNTPEMIQPLSQSSQQIEPTSSSSSSSLSEIIKITVLGSGSFGTALASVLARNGHEISILTRYPDVVEEIAKNHKNPRCPFSDIHLPYNIRATMDPHTAFRNTSYIVHCIPVQASYTYLESLQSFIPQNVPIISCSKGLHTESLLFMSQIIPKALKNPEQPVAVLSGPTFAKELLMAYPSGAVVASSSSELRKQVAELFSSSNFRIFTSNDVIGVEIAGALKNVYAIAAGILEGLGLKDNTLAFLCTRAIAEMNSLARALGSTEMTLAGLAGIGDLVLSCWGSSSRNRLVGLNLGKGKSLENIIEEMSETAEGVWSAPASLKLAQHLNVDTPILHAVVDVLQNKTEPLHAIMGLMKLSTGYERIFF